MMASVLRIWALIVKEFHSVWRDPKSRSLLFLPPIIQLFLFSHAATLDIENITLAVLNEDSTPISRDFTSKIEASPYFKRIIYVKNLAGLQSAIDNEEVRGGLYIKNDFSKNLKRGNASVEVILDGRHTNGSQIIGNYIAEIAAGTLLTVKMAKQCHCKQSAVIQKNCRKSPGLLRSVGPRNDRLSSSVGLRNDRLSCPVGRIELLRVHSLHQAVYNMRSLRCHSSQNPPCNDSMGAGLRGGGAGAGFRDNKTPDIAVKTRHWYNPNLYYHWFIISSLVGILSMSMVLLLSALSLAREKESGTFDQILVSPLRPYEIITGKLMVPLFFGIVDAAIILLSAKFIFKIPIAGNIFLYFFALILFLISILGVGLFISSLAKTQQQAILGVFVFMFPAMILSGYSAPVENITPKILQNLTVVNPLRFFLVISKGIILKDFTFKITMLNLVPIILISIFTLFVANFSFKNKLG